MGCVVKVKSIVRNVRACKNGQLRGAVIKRRAVSHEHDFQLHAGRDSVITLHADGETSLSFPLEHEAAADLNSSINTLLATFREKDKVTKEGGRPRRWDGLNFQHRSEENAVQLEVFCNPNAFSSAFNAKALVTLSSSLGVQVVTECSLSSIQSDVEAFL